MGDATAAVTASWDRLLRLSERIDGDDWGRATACPGLDIASLIAHVAGLPSQTLPRRGASTLLDGLRAARRIQLVRTASWGNALSSAETSNDVSVDRLVGAWCSDLWVHGHDLSSALGEPSGIDDDAADVMAACRYLLRFVPYVFARRAGADEGDELRLVVGGAVDQDRVLTVREGRGVWSSETSVTDHAVSASPGALVLLLSGRADPGQLRELGVLHWWGTRGEAFVRRARILPA